MAIKFCISLDEAIAKDLKTFAKGMNCYYSDVIQDALKMYFEVKGECQVKAIDKEKETFYDFMTDEKKPVSKRARNALIRNGITTIKQLAEAKSEDFLGFRNIGFATAGYIFEKQNEARSMLGMENENRTFDYMVAMQNYQKKLDITSKRKIFG